MPAERRLLTGWGRTAPTAATVVTVEGDGELAATLAAARSAPVVRTPGPTRASRGRGVVARGLGRSYGDAAQNAGGTVVRLGRPGQAEVVLDGATGAVRATGGTSLDAVLRALVPHGWFVPVTPGTRHVTVGGAVAADIHGKNHHRDGSWCNHVCSLELVGPSGQARTVGPGASADPEAFWATAGGMGLTGVVTAATFQALPIETSRLLVDTTRHDDLDAVMATMAATDARYRYSVAWVDLSAPGGRLGRGVLTQGDHAPLAALAAADRAERQRALAFAPAARLAAPPWVPSGLLNRWSIRAFDAVWLRAAPRRRLDEVQTIPQFFHPLDGVHGWNRVYGRHGFVQYQFVVPDGAEAIVRAVMERLRRGGAASFVTVLKRFGPAGPGPLSFPLPGWTLALDLPVTVGLGPVLDACDRLVATAGGRVYLAKDSRLVPELVPVMYPRLDEWRAVRARLDPDGVWQSDLGRRLGLAGGREQGIP